MIPRALDRWIAEKAEAAGAAMREKFDAMFFASFSTCCDRDYDFDAGRCF